SGGGGGGGRIAIYYELMPGILDENISVNGGTKGDSNSSITGNGEVGTIYKALRKYLPYVYGISLPVHSPLVVSSLELEFSIPMNASTISVADVVVIDHFQQPITPIS